MVNVIGLGAGGAEGHTHVCKLQVLRKEAAGQEQDSRTASSCKGFATPQPMPRFRSGIHGVDTKNALAEAASRPAARLREGYRYRRHILAIIPLRVTHRTKLHRSEASRRLRYCRAFVK
jgi:hypothetical protein